MKYALIVASFMIKVVFFTLGMLLSYYIFATIIGGIVSLSTWSFLFMKELYIFWNKPTSIISAAIRAVLWVIGLGAGESVIKEKEQIS